MYLIDTNVMSAMRRPERVPQVAIWLRGRAEGELFLSAITIGEIEREISLKQGLNMGIAADLRAWLDHTMLVFADRILPFGAEDARIWGRLSDLTGDNSAVLMVAATALKHDATVVTGNMADFASTGVRAENPFDTD